MMNKELPDRTYRRKYLGLIQNINGHNFFIPMSSPKDKDFDPKTGKIKKAAYLQFICEMIKNFTERCVLII